MSDDKETDLHSTTDAAAWAREFCKMYPAALCQVSGRGGVTDGDDFEHIMLGWFANAIMAGVDSEANKAAAALTDALARVQSLEDFIEEVATAEPEVHRAPAPRDPADELPHMIEEAFWIAVQDDAQNLMRDET